MIGNCPPAPGTELAFLPVSNAKQLPSNRAVNFTLS